jgi:hypothetical protein
VIVARWTHDARKPKSLRGAPSPFPYTPRTLVRIRIRSGSPRGLFAFGALMARPTLATHPKFALLAQELASRALARGCLELIWEAAYASGDPVIGRTRTVEALADWRGPRGELATALVDCGFLDVMQTDANGEHLLKVHDLEDHAPDYVLKRWERESKRREDGETIRTIRQRAAAKGWESRMQTDANGSRLQANVATPAPAPAPITDQIGGSGSGAPAEDSKPWTAPRWLSRFKLAWEARNVAGARAFYGDTGDTKAQVTLSDELGRLPGSVRALAEASAPAMFAAFFKSDGREVKRRQHPFSFFVQEFGALRTAAGKNGPAAPRDDRPPEIPRWAREARK